MKNTEEFLDEKREEAIKQASSTAESVLNPSSVLGKAKGFLNCEYERLFFCVILDSGSSNYALSATYRHVKLNVLYYVFIFICVNSRVSIFIESHRKSYPTIVSI